MFVFLFFLFLSVTNGFIQVDPTTNHLVDENGRVRFFHGINLVEKSPPYYPQVTESDVKQMSQLGFNVVRLGCMWEALEPVRGQYNMTYLGKIIELVHLFGKYNITVVLDNHQDIIGRRYCGEGFPDWISPKKDSLPFPIPVNMKKIPLDPKTGYPVRCNDTSYWGLNYFTDVAGSAFQNIYDNYDGYQDSLIGYWKLVSSTFNRTDNVLGYDLINEPWAGDIYTDPRLILEPGYADWKNFQPMYQKIGEMIYKVDPNHLVFFEPVTWDYLETGFTAPPTKNHLSVLSYHIYCLDYHGRMKPEQWKVCNISSFDMFDKRKEDIKRLAIGGFMTEFGELGDTPDGRAELGNMTWKANQLFQSWTYWGFDFNDNGLTKILTQTYPVAVAGEPISLRFDRWSGYFDFTFRFNSDIEEQKPTVIFANQKVWYPDGANVIVTPIFNIKQWGNWYYLYPVNVKNGDLVHVMIA